MQLWHIVNVHNVYKDRWYYIEIEYQVDETWKRMRWEGCYVTYYETNLRAWRNA